MQKTDGNLVELDLQSKFLQQFKVDVSDGLNANLKTLPSKYFYDEKGDELFVKIMNLPEYYLTRSEMEIFEFQTDKIINSLDIYPAIPFQLIELGAGDGSKTLHLLKRLTERGYNFEYQPIDISPNALDGLEKSLKKVLPTLNISPQVGDYFEVLADFKSNDIKKVVLFLGSNIGNLKDDKAKIFLDQLDQNLNQNDVLFLGVDVIKPEEIVLPAYNDSQGITRAFNLNLLQRMNDELESNFDLDNFSHVPFYDEEEGIAKSFIRSDIDQEVYIKGIGQDFFFEEGELVHTEISRKYNDEIIASIIGDSNFEITEKLMDESRFFADYVFVKS